MKLAIIGSRGFPSTYGGYETLVRYLARDLARRGHHVTVYCRTRDEGRRSWTTEGIRCICTPGRDTKSLSTLSFGLTSALDATLRGFDAALVLNVANGFWLPLLHVRGIPTAVNTDGIEWERGKWGRLARAVFRLGARLTARYADELIADSEAIGDIWSERFGARSTYIPYGAPVLTEVQSDLLERVGLAPETYLLVVARLIPENNVELTLDALQLLGDAAPPTVIVGSANFESSLGRRLEDLNERGAVRWLGHVDDQRLLTQLWAHAGLYVHGHSVGGTNPALVQALGAGAPTLALDTSFNREVVRGDDQLFPADARVLADRIKTLLPDQTTRIAMREQGQRTISQHYQWDDVCARYLQVLERIAWQR